MGFKEFIVKYIVSLEMNIVSLIKHGKLGDFKSFDSSHFSVMILRFKLCKLC